MKQHPIKEEDFKLILIIAYVRACINYLLIFCKYLNKFNNLSRDNLAPHKAYKPFIILFMKSLHTMHCTLH